MCKEPSLSFLRAQEAGPGFANGRDGRSAQMARKREGLRHFQAQFPSICNENRQLVTRPSR